MSTAAHIETLCEAPSWEEASLDFQSLFERLSALVAEKLLPWCASEWHVSVLLTDDAGIRPLNAQYRGKDKATNVLSFGVFEVPVTQGAWDAHTFGGAPFFLGDIALAYETVTHEAADEAKSLQNHVAHLFVHGLLHLLGYDHETEDEAHVMESLESEILAGIDIPNPYILEHLRLNESEQDHP